MGSLVQELEEGHRQDPEQQQWTLQLTIWVPVVSDNLHWNAQDSGRPPNHSHDYSASTIWEAWRLKYSNSHPNSRVPST